MTSTSPETPKVTADPVKGRCLCGRVTFEIHAEPIVVSSCHCSNCRLFTGTAFTTNVVFPANSHKVTSGENLITVYLDEVQDSGNNLKRYFCSICGSPLYTTGGDFGKTMSTFYSALEAEGFDQPHHGPTIEYYAKERLPWVPRFEKTEPFRTKPGRD